MTTSKIPANALLERFLRYVRIDTTASTTATDYPSTPGQLVLSRLLADELRVMGLADTTCSEFGIVMATIPATVSHATPTMAWIAHVDTSPAVSGAHVQPQVHRQYNGAPIVLPGDPTKVINSDNTPELPQLIGKTLVTTDGTTLLGADDKAGVAIIMQTAAFLLAHPEMPHGPIRICFTCDEEIGHGTAKVDMAALAAHVGYTLDGGGAGVIDVETFCADKVTITCTGVSTHPGAAKNKLVNAARMAAALVEALPTALAPECTDGREGFIHPESFDGNAEKTTIHGILRDFDESALQTQATLLQQLAAAVCARYPGGKIAIETSPQYRNMRLGLEREPRAVAYAAAAMRDCGLEPQFDIIRGGTDGSQLTTLGLPTPNLSSGQHNLHSPLEFAVLEEMQLAGDVLVALAQRWAE